MRKLLFALPLLAGASWAGTTYYAGSQTEPAYDSLISQLNEFKPWNFESEDYQAGFLQSIAITKVMDSEGPNAKLLFRLQHVINHSPVGVDGNSPRIGASTINTTMLTSSVKEEYREWFAHFDNQQPFELFTRVGINGNIDNELSLSAFSMKNDNITLDFHGGRLSAQSTGEGIVKGDGALSEITMVTNDNFNLAIDPSTASFDLVRHAAGIYAGKYETNFPEIQMNLGQPGLDVTLGNLNVISDSEVESNEMSGRLLMQAETIDAPVDIDSASYEVVFKGLGMDALQKYQDSIQDLQNTSDDSPEQMFSAVATAYQALLAPGTHLGANIGMANSGGSIKGGVSADFNGDGSVSGYDSISTLRDLLMAVDVQINLAADADALAKTPLAMAMMHPAASEYIVSDGLRHVSDVKISNLILDVNGNPQSLEDLVGGALSMPLSFALLGSK